MIKKVAVGAVLLIVTLAVLVVGYLFSIKAKRPSALPEPVSVLHNELHARSAIRAERWLGKTYQRHVLPSISVSVGIHGELVWEGAIGYSDLDDEVLADPHTEYRIGSISKAITATAVMRMQEQQIIRIEDSFETYVKDYPAEHAGYTLKQLLAHQGGVRHYTNQLSENFSTKKYGTTREAASVVENDALVFAPGEGFHYSTYGYTLLALAMETAYSAPFERLMYDEVFLPAGMTATSFEKADKAPPDSAARAYLHVGDSIYESPHVNVSYKYAGGGYLSTPSDLVRFSNALLNQELLNRASIESLWTPVPLSNGDMNPQNYALGFRVGEDDLGRFVHHGGKSVGGYSFLLIYPETGVVVAFASNITPSGNSLDRLREAKALARFFLDNDHEP